MNFFIDNNLSQRLAAGMKEFGEDVVHLAELFEPDTEDVAWLQHIGENNFVLVTRDERIRKHPAELAALKKYKVGAFFLGGKSRSRCELIQQLVRNWPRMKELAGSNSVPFAYRVPPTGTKIARIPLP